jgi:hypothetical protein
MARIDAGQGGDANLARPRFTGPRWNVIGIAVFVGAWLTWVALGVVRSASNLQHGGLVGVRSFVFGSLYEFTIVPACVGTYFGVRAYNRAHETRVSFLAVFAAVAAVMNPSIVEMFFRASGLPVAGRGDSEIRSFMGGALAVAVGAVALLRDRDASPRRGGAPRRRSRAEEGARAVAAVGVAAGLIFVGFWVLLFVMFIVALSRGGAGLH